MKNIVFIFCFLFSGLCLTAQSAVSTMFQKYASDTKFTSVHITEHLFGLLEGVEVEDSGDQSIVELAKGLKELIVLTTEENGAALFEEASQKINTAAYKQIMSVRDKEENVRIFIREEGKIINELLVLVGSPQEFVLVNLVGVIDLKKIAQLAQKADVKGLEHIQKINNND